MLNSQLFDIRPAQTVRSLRSSSYDRAGGNIDFRRIPPGGRGFDYCWERDLPFVLVSHYHSLACAGGTGYTIHDRFLPRLLESGRAEPLGMVALHRRHARPKPAPETRLVTT